MGPDVLTALKTKEQLDRIEKLLEEVLARPTQPPQFIPYPVFPHPQPPVRPWSPWDQYPHGPFYS